MDFEVLIGRDELQGKWREAWKSGVADDLAQEKDIAEGDRRRLGLLWMTDKIRREVDEETGRRVTKAFSFVEGLVLFLMALVGIGVLRGLLVEFQYFMEAEDEVKSVTAKGFHIWVLLGVGVVLPLVLMLMSVLGYWLWRRWSGGLGVFRGMMAGLVKKFSGSDLDGKKWRGLMEEQGVKDLVAGRLGRILQFGGVGYALGIMAGLFGAMLFMEVGFFWETSLPQFGEQALVKTTRGLETPFVDLVTQQDVEESKLMREPISAEALEAKQRVHIAWFSFFLFAIFVWVLLPRFLLWLVAGFAEGKYLRELDFQEGRHRALWREVAKVERGVVKGSQADGVVVLDVGGLEITNDEVRPFLLQEMRVNPTKRHSLGLLDERKEEEAIEAVRASEQGVVFLAEGWNLSPKQMQKNYERVKQALAGERERMIWFLVMGTEEEYGEWVKFVDGLRDELVEVIHYES